MIKTLLIEIGENIVAIYIGLKIKITSKFIFLY